MKFKALMIIAVLWLYMPLQAQDNEYPTLDALAKLEIPAYDYVDLARRVSRIESRHIPPSNPPAYQIGDRDSFMLPASQDYSEEAASVELRGMTENVLVWVDESVAFSRNKAQALAEQAEEKILVPLHRLFNFSEPPGIDGDPRFNVVIMQNPEFPQTGTFARNHLVPRTHFPESNQREMVVVNLELQDGALIDNEMIAEVAAHEFQHVLLHHRDASEELWLNEALSTFSQY